MADNTQRLVRELFDAASDLPSAERQSWVEARAEGNPEVIASVMRLLRAANSSGQGFLAEPAWKREQPTIQEGVMIGPYRVLRELGSGGMGVVYLAMRSDEVYRRLAAVKVIRPELRTHPIKDRFLQERDILARLDHPNIARIIDGGNTPDGLPYFVMDYVDGLPLDEFCRKHQVSMDQRLDLFRQTCEAVQYLHENNVLHRDLKPANILVTNNGQIKLLDFGVSKLTGEFSTNLTTGMPILTAGYASPEQITSKEVTPAADIYSLGVVLYELLTGVRPLKLDGLTLNEVLNTITSQIPVKPSTQAPLPEEADPGRLLATFRPRLAGDLDSILLMALRKEPGRRYATASDFAADVQRYQQRRSVVARGDGRIYLVSKTLRRHRLAIAAMALIAVSLAFGGAAYYRVLQLEDQLDAIAHRVAKAKTNEAKLQSLPPDQRQAVLQEDLNQLTTAYETKTPEILKSNLVSKDKTRQLTLQTLNYFADTTKVTSNDPTTVAALGRAYLAVAETQWSPDHASLNDPAAAANTCLAALRTLNASQPLSTNPEVSEVASRITSQLEQNPATRQ
jgi:serine/threonine protein kinase